MHRSRPMNLEMMLPDGPPRPRRSLRTKAIVAAMALVAIPTMLTGYLTHRYAAEAMERALLRDSEMLSRTAEHLMDGWVNEEESSKVFVDKTLDLLMRDDRIAFLVITDRRGRVIGHRYTEPMAWHEYQSQLTEVERHTPLTLNRSIALESGDSSLLVVRRQAIRRGGAGRGGTSRVISGGASGGASEGAAGGGGGIVGTIELGLRDPRQPRVLADLRDTTILMVAVICLLYIPLVIWWVRGQVRPLRQMLAGTQRLSLGDRFEPIDIRRDDEIGMLADSFNAMGANLSTVQRALVTANERLEQDVADRTRRLQQANEQLQREVEESDQLLRAVSHDLGAPLRNIAGLTSMLMLKYRSDVSEEVMEKLGRISANVSAETELIDDLLELNRIKTRPGRRRRVDLGELVRSIADQLGYDLEHKRIVLEIETPLPTVLAERNRMRQVFQNLIDNAIKYMPEDAAERRIGVGWTRTGRGQGRAFYVRDTGGGIAGKDREAIFQVFRRARYSGTKDVAGRGVGLASVKTIVACYGGHIWVESDPPGGATFYFTLDARYVGKRRDGAELLCSPA